MYLPQQGWRSCVHDLCQMSDFTCFHVSSIQLKPDTACQLVGNTLLHKSWHAGNTFWTIWEEELRDWGNNEQESQWKSWMARPTTNHYWNSLFARFNWSTFGLHFAHWGVNWGFYGPSSCVWLCVCFLAYVCPCVSSFVFVHACLCQLACVYLIFLTLLCPESL